MKIYNTSRISKKTVENIFRLSRYKINCAPFAMYPIMYAHLAISNYVCELLLCG